MKILSSLLGLVLLVLAVSFALSNRQTANISLWPLDLTVEAPLYLMTLGTLGVGLLVGAGGMWLSLLPHRFAAKRLHADIAALHEKLNDLQADIAARGRHGLMVPDVPLHRRLWDRARGCGKNFSQDTEQ